MTHRPIPLTPLPLTRLVGALQSLVEGKLWRKVVLGFGLGVLIGFTLGPELGWVRGSVASVLVEWAALPGTLFLAMVQMIVVPLVFASIIGGLAANDDTKKLRALGIRAGLYFTSTTVIAISLGLAVAFVIRPGRFVAESLVPSGAAPQAGASSFPTLGAAPQMLVSLLPENPLAALANGQMLEIVLFAFVVGIALVVMPESKARPMLDLLESMQSVCMTVVEWAMKLAPLAVFGLSIRLTATLGLDALAGIAAYMGTVLLGLLLLAAAYGLMIAVFARRSPLAFFRAARDVQLLGFSTSSSAAVMPLSMRTAENAMGVRPEVARFVIPLGATINMDGTALYQGVAAAFLIQVYGVDVGIGGIALLVVTVVAASIGAPAAPGVGIVILAGVLEGVGIPTGGIALLLGVDRLLDMARTGVNVTGDLTAAVVLDRWLSPEPAEPLRAAPESERPLGAPAPQP